MGLLHGTRVHALLAICQDELARYKLTPQCSAGADTRRFGTEAMLLFTQIKKRGCFSWWMVVEYTYATMTKALYRLHEKLASLWKGIVFPARSRAAHALADANLTGADAGAGQIGDLSPLMSRGDKDVTRWPHNRGFGKCYKAVSYVLFMPVLTKHRFKYRRTIFYRMAETGVLGGQRQRVEIRLKLTGEIIASHQYGPSSWRGYQTA